MCRSAHAAPARRGSGCRRTRSVPRTAPRSRPRPSSSTVMISCTMPSLHHHDAVGDQHRLVEIVRVTNWDGLARCARAAATAPPCMVSRVCASSAPNGSSISSTLGSIASARAMPTRCFMSAGELVRAAAEQIREPDELEVAPSRCRAQLDPAHALHLRGRTSRSAAAVSHGRQLGELEHHAAIVAAAPAPRDRPP